MKDERLRRLFKEELPQLRAPEELRLELLGIPRRRRRWWLWAPAPALAAVGLALALLIKARPGPSEPEGFVVLPMEGEVLSPEEVEIVAPKGRAVVILDGEPLEPVKVNGEALFKPEDLEPGYHKVEVKLGERVLERIFYVL